MVIPRSWLNGGFGMRGRDDRDEGFFSYVRLEERVPADHPLRAIRSLVDEALAALNGRRPWR